MQTEDLIPATECCLHYQIEDAFLSALKEYGLIEVITVASTDFIHHEQLSQLEKLVRLHYDLNINFEGIDVITHLLKQLEAMQSEINFLRNRLRLYEPVE